MDGKLGKMVIFRASDTSSFCICFPKRNYRCPSYKGKDTYSGVEVGYLRVRGSHLDG